MPRVIDTDERNRQVAEAAWRVLVREGLPALSVRKVAAEAGLPPSSLRYTFPTQASLRISAYALVVERLAERVAAIEPGADWARAVLLELLPLDESRRLEMEITVVLGTAAMADGDLRATHHRAHRAVRDLCERVVRAVEVDPADVRVQTERLHAMMDGLALHMIRQGEDEGTDWAVRVVDTHLAGLERAPSPRALPPTPG
ncbi:TetR/AcrR family transcriptional regulator [Streptomyces griseus]|uniref:TetR-family transcriptional regulator n=1 Tax=Streptomyces griseus subsp. griseus (strain JCM 4626 / CBS 651.72 / NBRC 13350 / KCC S-0626 / ISP 5235) TaxID=455632 RepID=B1W4K8_STRGG|nr:MULTISPECIES: TetR family transcriptional regulator C-terminal domain-containing protein [Streptomyces]MYR12516.1 TetR family transcriptional regulator [Streptomyces sp. SID724]MYT76046.1 TetR family transcriptional regulator [Streptomyces sp. SID8364]MBW3708779.1 TetR family transcriptional regulator [Streptomyces griseus]NEB51177.1 TetR family transcriptional regulator [Streptomyces griseus]SBU95540.1 transcriptional regulator, TetR family [Streptomyces sp. MnatMP-M77]